MLGLKGRKSEGFNYIKRFYWSTKDTRVIYYKKTGLSLIENTRDVFTYEWKFYSERTRNERSVNRARNLLCIPINKYVTWTRSKWGLPYGKLVANAKNFRCSQHIESGERGVVIDLWR